MPYPEICELCIYRGEEITSNNLVCQNHMRWSPNDDENCDDFWEGDEFAQPQNAVDRLRADAASEESVSASGN